MFPDTTEKPAKKPRNRDVELAKAKERYQREKAANSPWYQARLKRSRQSVAKKRKDKAYRRREADRDLVRKYGDGVLEWVEEREKVTGGRCECCGYVFEAGRKGGRSRCVDHDHETGGWRGILCTRCNSALGMLNDSLDQVLRLADYIREHHLKVVDPLNPIPNLPGGGPQRSSDESSPEPSSLTTTGQYLLSLGQSQGKPPQESSPSAQGPIDPHPSKSEHLHQGESESEYARRKRNRARLGSRRSGRNVSR
jgi:hypothetical protein